MQRTLTQVIELDKDLEYIYLKAKILNINATVYGQPYEFIPVNVQVQEYWHKKELELHSDTLTIFDDTSCHSSEFQQDSVHLIIAYLDQGIYRTGVCKTNWVFSQYGEGINQLGKGFKVQMANSSKPVEELKPPVENRFQLSNIISFVSILLNAVLIFLLLKRKQSST